MNAFKLPEDLKIKYLKKKEIILSEEDLTIFLKHLSEPLDNKKTLKAAKIAYYDMLTDIN